MLFLSPSWDILVTKTQDIWPLYSPIAEIEDSSPELQSFSLSYLWIYFLNNSFQGLWSIWGKNHKELANNDTLKRVLDVHMASNNHTPYQLPMTLEDV